MPRVSQATDPLPFNGSPEHQAAMRTALQAHGFAVLQTAVPALNAAAAAADPYGAATVLFGKAPLLLEKQTIRPVEGATSFAAGQGDAPLHTDSQRAWGRPAHALVMFCQHPAEQGGDTTLADGWSILERLQQDRTALSAMASQVHRLSFYFGVFECPLVEVHDQEMWLTCPPQPPQPLLGACKTSHAFKVKQGQVLVVDNHRMLHGRRGFSDARRAFVRLLTWLDAPLGSHPGLRSAVTALGPAQSPLATPDPRVVAVLALLRGEPPARVCRQAGVDEPQLYAWREALLATAQIGAPDGPSPVGNAQKRRP